nr:hypothetical protein [Tersicoccus phoenicis]
MEDRLVVCHPIPENMDTFHRALQLGSMSPVAGDSSETGRNSRPDRCLVSAGQEKPPEAERQFCDHLARGLDPVLGPGAESGRTDVVLCTGGQPVLAVEVPTLAPGVRGQLSVDHVAEQNFHVPDALEARR